MKLRLAIPIVVIALLIVGVVPALAHALLVRSIPEANAALDRAPAQIELFFSEAVDPAFSAIKVLDATGQTVDNDDHQVDPADATHLTISVRSLPDGIYTVSWKALSATDGHVTAGSFPFAVGNVDAAALTDAAQASRQIKLSIGEVIAKWWLYLSVMALVGGVVFSAVVWQPARIAAQIDRAAAQAAWQRLTNFALLGLLVASAIGLLVQAGQVSGSEIAAPWDAATNGVLFATRFGSLWLARLALTFALVGLMTRNLDRLQSSRRERGLMSGAGWLLLLTISLGSHAAGESQPLLPVAADGLHLLAASIWVGGLIFFVSGVWSIRKIDPIVRTRFTALLIPRFSALALISIAALIVTGVYAAILRVGTFEALFNTIYGRALIVKILIALLMIGLGAINLLIVTPRIKRSTTSRLADRFRVIVTSEVLLGAVLLLSVGVLTSLPPARITSSTTDLNAAADVDDLHIALDIAPGRVGVNTFAVTVTANGEAVDNARTVEARFTPANGNIAPGQAQLSAQGHGEYAIKGAYLSLPDTWQVQIVVRRENKYDAYADFTFALNATGATADVPWNRWSGALLWLAALAYTFACRGFEFSRRRQIPIEFVPALALLVIGTLVFAQDSLEQTGPINPLPPNAASVATGKTIFEEKCVPCHGESGKGDGPIGLTLNPRPADLTQHAVPGVHTDGQLFDWITNGFPGSVMPPFRQALRDDDRWNVVNFIRTLAPK